MCKYDNYKKAAEEASMYNRSHQTFNPKVVVKCDGKFKITSAVNAITNHLDYNDDIL